MLAFYDRMVIIVGFIAKTYVNFFKYAIFQITYTMCSTCTMRFIVKYLSSNFSYEFSYNFFCWFVNNFIFFLLNLIFFIAYSLKDSKNFFMQSLSLYKSCLFSISLNGDIADIEKPDGICSLSFVLDDFSGLSLHSSIFSIKDSRSA